MSTTIKAADLIESVAAALQEMRVDVEAVDRLIGQIAQATGEQSAGVEEINHAIAQIDTATQQNAALVEEASASAAAFQQEAARLVQVVGAFRISREPESGLRAPAALGRVATAH